ncbi:MAG: hypothetical protein ACO4CG_05525 [Prochlorothrix sp.]
MKQYKVLLHHETHKKATDYIEKLKAGSRAGNYLRNKLKDVDIPKLTPLTLFEQLIGTKIPKIFAESAVYGDGTDWNPIELSILGDINIAVPVTVFDDGKHHAPSVHSTPFTATLLFTPGALLRNGKNRIPADWEEVTGNGRLNPEAYYRLYERRFLPLFRYADTVAGNQGKKAFITIPGIGCGQFAGKFKGQLGAELKNTLECFLKKYSDSLPNLKAVYYDPYRECENERSEIDGISFLVRPLTQGNHNKPQLCMPTNYEDEPGEFSNCELFSFVAWDHVSWPGNDFYVGARATDDGVKAAATDAMYILTGIEGKYDTASNQYNPPLKYQNWQEVVFTNQVSIEVQGNLIIN